MTDTVAPDSANFVDLHAMSVRAFWVTGLSLLTIYMALLVVWWPGVMGQDSLAMILEIESNRVFQSGKPVFWYQFVSTFYESARLVELPLMVLSLITALLAARLLGWMWAQQHRKSFWFGLFGVCLGPGFVYYTISLYSDAIFAVSMSALLFEVWLGIRTRRLDRWALLSLAVSLPFAVFVRPNGIINLLPVVALLVFVWPQRRAFWTLVAITVVWCGIAGSGMVRHKMTKPIGTVYPLALFETVNFLQPHAMGMTWMTDPRVSKETRDALTRYQPISLMVQFYDRDYWDPLVFFPAGPAMLSFPQADKDVVVREFFRHNLWRNMPAFLASRVNIFAVSMLGQGAFHGSNSAADVINATKSNSVYRQWRFDDADNLLHSLQGWSFDNNWWLWSPIPGLVMIAWLLRLGVGRRDWATLCVSVPYALQFAAIFTFSIAGEYRYLMAFFTAPLVVLPALIHARRFKAKD
jgi:hypothetical protein